MILQGCMRVLQGISPGFELDRVFDWVHRVV